MYIFKILKNIYITYYYIYLCITYNYIYSVCTLYAHLLVSLCTPLILIWRLDVHAGCLLQLFSTIFICVLIVFLFIWFLVLFYFV